MSQQPGIEVAASTRPAATRAPIVAIDGPAGSGKSTVAARVAEAIGVPHVDTGAYYRAVTLAALEDDVVLTDEAACAAVARSIHIERVDGRTLIDGHDVEDEIRGPAVTAAVSAVSAHGSVREALVPLQREAVQRDGGVMEGRDIGTVVLPAAHVKVFLTASVEARAQRRADQAGESDVSAIAASIVERDADDSTRSVAPLVRADDAWELDTTDLSIDQVVTAIVDRVRAVAAPVRRTDLPRVVIVGRPNVGKSTLVNRILGQRVTIVEEKPGVTRDRTEHVANWLGRNFLLVDTGGWEHRAEGMGAQIVSQAERAISEADLVLFVVDVTVGLLEDDERYAKVLRRSNIPTMLVANKADGPKQEMAAHELYGVGLGQPWPVAARHGRGVGDLLDEVLGNLPDERMRQRPDESHIPRVAIVGKPNVGKSSLFNRLVGEERSIVDSVAHTTRDSVDTVVDIEGQTWCFVDTAGLRHKYRTGEDTELFSVDRTRRAIEMSDLVLFVLDASDPVSEQDQRLAALIRDAGRGLVIVLNKWDEVDDQRRIELERELDRLLHFAQWAPRVNISALTGRALTRITPHLLTVWAEYRRRIPTRELNRWLLEVTMAVPPPTDNGRPMRVKYITQISTGPPRFIAFANNDIPDAYRRYLLRQLRERYGFGGVPLELADKRGRSERR